MKFLTLTLVFVGLTSVKVMACGDGSCKPPEPTPEPPKIILNDSSSDYDYKPYERIYYSICTCEEFKVAWGFESLDYRTAKARSQCEIRRTEKLKCPVKWK